MFRTQLSGNKPFEVCNYIILYLNGCLPYHICPNMKQPCIQYTPTTTYPNFLENTYTNVFNFVCNYKVTPTKFHIMNYEKNSCFIFGWIWQILHFMLHTLSPSFVHTPCCTTPNSPVPNSLFTMIASAGMMCLLGTFTAGFSKNSSGNAHNVATCSSFRSKI